MNHIEKSKNYNLGNEKYQETMYCQEDIECSGVILDKLKARDFNATNLSTYDFSTLYTTLPHNLIKDKLIDLIERTFNREGSPYLACNDRNTFFLRKTLKITCMHGLVKMYVMRLFVGQHFYSIWHQVV